LSKRENTLEEDYLVEDEEDIRENKFLMCKIGREFYGIDIRVVTDIIELQTITEVPDMPGYVRGVINLRGQVIPVIDLRLHFGMPFREYDDRTVIAVVHINDTSIGFIIDTATEVQSIPEKDIDPAPSFQHTRRKGKYIAGLGKIGEEVTIILDMAKLVDREEAAELTASLN